MTKNSILGTAIAAGLFLMAAGPANAQSSIQFSDAHALPSGDVIAGAGILERSNQAVDLKLALQDLDANAAYTTWWVVFNNPENCASLPCTLPDLGNSATNASVLWATGFVTGTGGSANVTAHLDARHTLEGRDVLFGPGLEQGNGFLAEIHVLVRSHETAVAGETAGQIGTVDGFCNVNACADQQAVIFLPMP